VVAARELRDIRLGEWRTRFAKARAGITLSPEDIAAAVEHSHRRSGFSSIATDSVIQEEVGWEIDDFANRHGITLAPGTQPWRQLGPAFMQAYASDRHRDAVEAMGEIPTLPAITVLIPEGSRPSFRDDAARHSEMISPAVPR
jgi:hypothetical protein